MLRLDGDHTNWVLVVILVAMALLLALVSSSAYGDVQQANPQAAQGNEETGSGVEIPVTRESARP